MEREILWLFMNTNFYVIVKWSLQTGISLYRRPDFQVNRRLGDYRYQKFFKIDGIILDENMVWGNRARHQSNLVSRAKLAEIFRSKIFFRIPKIFLIFKCDEA